MLLTIDRFIEKTCRGLLIVSVMAMLVLSLMTILLRFFSITFLWMDPLVRHLVFFATFLGAILAAGKGEHISFNLKFQSRDDRTSSLLYAYGRLFCPCTNSIYTM